MRKWVVMIMGVLVMGLVGWADVSWGTGDPASASLDVTVEWNAYNWIIIYIPAGDMNIDLGTISPDLYNPETGTWTPLTDAGGPRSVMVITNDAEGFRLQISGTLVSCPNDHGNPDGILGRLTLSSKDLGVKDAPLSGTITYTGSRGRFLADDIVYEYTPSFDDTAGKYSVIVTYTAITN